MIGKLKGIVDSIIDNSIIIDIAGIGYIVEASQSLLNFYKVGDPITACIHTLIKDEQITLYGFSNLKEKEWFLRLQEVQGVGAKMSMQIVGIMKTDDIINSILAEDAIAFKSIPGIGQKIASRIINELKNHKSLHNSNFLSNTFGANSTITEDKKDSTIIQDAISVLINLGYSRKDAFVAISNIYNDQTEILLEDLIKKALNKMSGHKN